MEKKLEKKLASKTNIGQAVKSDIDAEIINLAPKGILLCKGYPNWVDRGGDLYSKYVLTTDYQGSTGIPRIMYQILEPLDEEDRLLNEIGRDRISDKENHDTEGLRLPGYGPEEKICILNEIYINAQDFVLCWQAIKGDEWTNDVIEYFISSVEVTGEWWTPYHN